MTPTEAIRTLLAPTVFEAYLQDAYTIRVAAELDLPKYNFDIPRTSLVLALNALSRQANRSLLAYLSNDPQEEHTLVGPLTGKMNIYKGASQLIEGVPNLAIRVYEDDQGQTILSVENPTTSMENPTTRTRGKSPPTVKGCLRPTNRVPPPSELVTVIETRLPAFEHVAPVTVLDRRAIDQIGAATIPDLLKNFPQTAFSRPAGYRTSGSQYAEMRGLGADYTLVLINGRRAYGSASDLLVTSFDLNTIPITAVERIEISLDSPSLLHGTDAIGGILNIILKHDIEGATAEARYGSADGGAAERRGTLGAGIDSDRGKASVVLDYFEVDRLPGAARDRWRNQDFTRYGAGAVDQRSRFSIPGNVRSLDGSLLPGLDSPFAAIDVGSSGASFRPGELNRTSLLAFQDIVPEIRRASLSGTASVEMGRAMLTGETLIARRDTNFRLVPSIVPGYLWGPDHPQNPFGAAVILETALSGLPAREQRIESQLERGVVELSGPVGTWNASAYFLRSRETTRSQQLNAAAPLGVMSSLTRDDGDDYLNVLSLNPGEGWLPVGIIAPDHVDRFWSQATQLMAAINGPTVELPGGPVKAHLGLETRDEGVRFDSRVDEAARDVDSAFAQLTFPIVGSSMPMPGVAALELSAGLRRDDYSDVGSMLREQYGITWHPTSPLKVHAAYGESFAPPSLYALHLPVIEVPIQIFDPRRREVATVLLRTGGNSDLEPTTGTSFSMGASYGSSGRWRASLSYWRISMKNRVSNVLPQTLLAHEDGAIQGRIVRDTSDSDGSPGRLLALDISRANFGDTTTNGIDVSVEGHIHTSFGSFTSELSITRTFDFEYSDIPTVDAPERDRVGIASELGTITATRAVAKVAYEGFGWGATLFGRYASRYRDYSATTDAFPGREIPSQLLCDLNVTKKIGKYVTFTVGASNLFNSTPSYAVIGGAAGFDTSLDDLTGRKSYVMITGSL